MTLYNILSLEKIVRVLKYNCWEYSTKTVMAPDQSTSKIVDTILIITSFRKRSNPSPKEPAILLRSLNHQSRVG